MRDTVVICSIHEEPFAFQRTYGYVTIEAPKPGEPYALTTITKMVDRKSHGDDQWSDVPIPAEVIAKDLVEISGDLQKWGVFICAGEKPTKTELAAAEGRRLAWAQELVRMGDSEYMQGNRNPRLVPTACRWAANVLGEEREWNYRVTRKKPCPLCAEQIPEAALVHVACGWRDESLDKPEPEPVAAGAKQAKK